MDLGLNKKVALVGGGSRGAGRATSIALAQEGAAVVVAARNEESVLDAVEEIRGLGGRAIGIAVDMTTAAGAASAVAAASSSFGPPDILVTNAYPGDAPQRMTFEDAGDADFFVGHQNLIMGIVYATREVLPHMKEQRWGRLVNIGSHIVRRLHAPPTTMILSNINRLGAVGLMKSIAFDLGQYDITANTVGLGAIATDRSVGYYERLGLTLAAVEKVMASAEHPIGVPRFGLPEEVAAVVTFLCSQQASFVSGETINVTGGTTESPGL